MTYPDEKAEIAEAVAALRARFGIPVDPACRGPVALRRFLDELNLLYVSLPMLTRTAVANHLGFQHEGLEADAQPDELLAGCLLRTATDGFVFIGQYEPFQTSKGEEKIRFTTQPRQRFTAAHELGHFVLHEDQMDRFIADTKTSVVEDGGRDKARAMERQANQFAAELLMPGEVCRARERAFRKAYRSCPRGPFAYHLAAELLVSPEAMRFRLKELGVGDE